MCEHICLGIDTSNYTTSMARFDGINMESQRKLLPVAEGQRGLRQSDAVFHHTRQLPLIAERLFAKPGGELTCVAASVRPTEEDGSYMPCFLAGEGLARSTAATLGLPFYRFTHQQGHVAAALFGSGHTDWLERRFLAFHVSGGTTDALLVEPHADSIITCRKVAGSLDLKAGQLIDRIGVSLGLPFPAGAAMDAMIAEEDTIPVVKPSMEGAYCHLSGVENQAIRRIQDNADPKLVSLFCFSHIYHADNYQNYWNS